MAKSAAWTPLPSSSDRAAKPQSRVELSSSVALSRRRCPRRRSRPLTGCRRAALLACRRRCSDSGSSPCGPPATERCTPQQAAGDAPAVPTAAQVAALAGHLQLSAAGRGARLLSAPSQSPVGSAQPQQLEPPTGARQARRAANLAAFRPPSSNRRQLGRRPRTRSASLNHLTQRATAAAGSPLKRR